MAYTYVISLEDAKTYLGVDDNSRDTEITRMISSALSYLEKRTNIICDTKDKEYFFSNGCVRVYDYPINTELEDLPEGTKVQNKSKYSIYLDSTNESIILNVGDNNPDEDLVEAAFILIDHYFHEGDRSKVIQTVEDLIGPLRRFII